MIVKIIIILLMILILKMIIITMIEKIASIKEAIRTWAMLIMIIKRR